MELKKTKQPIMGLAALLIILYHLFPVSRSNDLFSSSVRFIVMTGYIGVDIFFFMTGYMSYFSITEKYFEYILYSIYYAWQVVYKEDIIYALRN